MKEIDLGTWRVFHPSHQRMDKWQALKVLEEAAEVVEAAKEHITLHGTGYEHSARIALTSEIADLLQTIVNLCDAYDITENQIQAARAVNHVKNIDRGMFDDTPRTHMHREEE